MSAVAIAEFFNEGMDGEVFQHVVHVRIVGNVLTLADVPQRLHHTGVILVLALEFGGIPADFDLQASNRWRGFTRCRDRSKIKVKYVNAILTLPPLRMLSS